MIRRRLFQLLEHGTVPTMALAIAIAPPDSMSRQTHDPTKPAKLRTDVLFSASTTGTMTLVPRDCEPGVASTKARCLTPELAARTTRDIADHRPRRTSHAGACTGKTISMPVHPYLS